MDDAALQSRILEYTYHLEDRQYLKDLAAAPGLDGVLAGLLRTGDAESVSFTSLAIRDLINYGIRASHDRAVIDTLEELVTAPGHSIRASAVYTLGKICSVSSLPVLHRAYYALLNHDPLLLPNLVGEIFWLEEEDSLELIDEAVASDQYLTRWSAFALLECIPCRDEELPEERDVRARVLARLRDDPHSRVRAEAVYQYALAEHEKHAPGMSQAERKAERREVERRRPRVCFENLQILFGNYLYHCGQHDYTVEELDRFVGEQGE